jgi:amino-acid N-acetyltransferase
MTRTLEDLRIAAATDDDLDDILGLLEAEGLPTADVERHVRNFVVAREGEILAGCGGAEAHQFAALIRSICVRPEYRSIGLGRRIVRELLDRLASRGLREFYLLTTDAADYFRKRGFREIDRDEVHPQLLSSTQFDGACPETAICMRLRMM